MEPEGKRPERIIIFTENLPIPQGGLEGRCSYFLMGLLCEKEGFSYGMGSFPYMLSAVTVIFLSMRKKACIYMDTIL